MAPIKLQAAGGATGPHTLVNQSYLPSVGSPTSYADGATLDGGLVGLMVWDPDGHITGIEGFAGGGGDDYCDIDLAKEVYAYPGFWGTDGTKHPQDEDSLALILPLLVAGEFNVELDFTWVTADLYCSAGVLAWQDPVTVQNDSAHIWSGLGPHANDGTSKFVSHVSGWGVTKRESIDGTFYNQTDRHKCRLEVSANGQTRYYFSPNEGSEAEHASPPSNDFINTVSSPHRLGFGLIGGVIHATKIRIYSLTVTAATVPAP